jgi:hypothetical protein
LGKAADCVVIHAECNDTKEIMPVFASSRGHESPEPVPECPVGNFNRPLALRMIRTPSNHTNVVLCADFLDVASKLGAVITATEMVSQNSPVPK